MARISLQLVSQQVVSPRFGNWPLTVIRLRTRTELRQSGGSYTRPLKAILDTGAPLSVLPRSLWQTLDTEIHVAQATFGGISQRKECQIPCAIGTVHLRLCDEAGNVSRVHDVPAFLAKTDRVPLILGFASLMEDLTIHFDYQKPEAWAEEK
ncbi:MAG: hypothetical protein HY318_09730 [Armatimonadetes bacterium]|nr:hypothetical protein [Armatimonadota bacterium]